MVRISPRQPHTTRGCSRSGAVTAAGCGSTPGCAAKRIVAPSLLRAPLPTERDLAVADLLRDAKALIDEPKNWTRRTYRSFGGQRCAVGALRAAAKRLNDPTIGWSAHALLINVARSRGFTNVETMNDRSPQAVVLSAFDQAIAMAERGIPAR